MGGFTGCVVVGLADEGAGLLVGGFTGCVVVGFTEGRAG